MMANGLDIVLALVLVGYAVIGYRHGFVVSVMSLVGFLSGAALGMWLMPGLLHRWGSVDNNVVWRTFVLVVGVSVFAAVGQAIAVSGGFRIRSGLRDEPGRLVLPAKLVLDPIAPDRPHARARRRIVQQGHDFIGQIPVIVRTGVKRGGAGGKPSLGQVELHHRFAQRCRFNRILPALGSQTFANKDDCRVAIEVNQFACCVD